MAKFKGFVGYSQQVETSEGLWEDVIIDKPCTGDVLYDKRKYQEVSEINDELRLANKFSIIANPFARNNFQNIKYVLYKGTKWKVTEVEYPYPRIIMSVGGVYNGS